MYYSHIYIHLMLFPFYSIFILNIMYFPIHLYTYCIVLCSPNIILCIVYVYNIVLSLLILFGILIIIVYMGCRNLEHSTYHLIYISILCGSRHTLGKTNIQNSTRIQSTSLVFYHILKTLIKIS